MVVWTLLAVPTIVWWKDSILWVSLMSLYAIIVSHWSALEAAKAEEELRKKSLEIRTNRSVHHYVQRCASS